MGDWHPESRVTGTSGRILRLLALLQRRPAWTGRELADRLGVDTRTVRRDIERVRILGYTVESNSGSSGGYRLGVGTDMPPLLLDEEEAMAVAVLLGVSAGAALPGIERAALATLARVERLLPPKLQHQVDALRAATVLLVGPKEPVPAAKLAPLAEACAEHRLVHFGYVARGGTASNRRAEPYRLVATSRLWYLVAFDLDRQDWRTFRVDRVQEVVVTGHTFAPRQLDDAGRLVEAALHSTPYRFRAQVRFVISPEELRKRVAPSVGVIEPCEMGSLLHIGADDTAWLASYLIGLDLSFEVLRPPELRADLHRMGVRLAATHELTPRQEGVNHTPSDWPVPEEGEAPHQAH
ncbi:MAG: helix-turn-helix transcriptional regulator [Acidimicrobiales bacterium]